MSWSGQCNISRQYASFIWQYAHQTYVQYNLDVDLQTYPDSNCWYNPELDFFNIRARISEPLLNAVFLCLLSSCATYFWAWAPKGPSTIYPLITGLCDVNYFTYWCVFIFSYVYLEVLKKLGWSKVGSLTQNGHKYSEYISQLQDFLIPKGIDFVMNRKFQENSPDMSMVRNIAHVLVLTDVPYTYSINHPNFLMSIDCVPGVGMGIHSGG